jgi:hypothetical protein
MEMENKYASKGVAGTALGLGAGALGVELLRGGLGGILGYGNNCGMCSDDHTINRYEAALQAHISELETEVKLRDSNIYTDSKILEVYKYFDSENKGIRNELAAQAVKNAQIEGTFAVLGEKIASQRNEFMCALNRERDERCCGDNAIVTYANATFYPKMVADITTGTTTTAQNVYNPIPTCGCCHK